MPKAQRTNRYSLRTSKKKRRLERALLQILTIADNNGLRVELGAPPTLRVWAESFPEEALQMLPMPDMPYLTLRRKELK